VKSRQIQWRLAQRLSLTQDPRTPPLPPPPPPNRCEQSGRRELVEESLGLRVADLNAELGGQQVAELGCTDDAARGVRVSTQYPVLAVEQRAHLVVQDKRGDQVVDEHGIWVTELVARPWLALFRPELSAMVQPLAGEWAIGGSMFSSLSIPTGYGVEISILLDVHSLYGLRAIAQVDLGQRAHRHQNIHDLGAMAVEVLAAADRRRFPSGVAANPNIAVLENQAVPPNEVLLWSMDEDRHWAVRTILTDERPPFNTVI